MNTQDVTTSTSEKTKLPDSGINIHPTKIIGVCDATGFILFTVEDNDGSTANVNIKTCTTVEYWDELTVKIREALAMMDLGND
jgi:hypothetical protein